MPSRSAGYSLFVPWVASEACSDRRSYPHQARAHCAAAATEGDEAITRDRVRVSRGSRMAGRRRMIQRLAFEVSVVIITAAITYTVTSWLAAWLAGGIQ